jgi:hypothetical protein
LFAVFVLTMRGHIKGKFASMLLPSKNESEGSGTYFLFCYGIFRIFQKWAFLIRIQRPMGVLLERLGVIGEGRR